MVLRMVSVLLQRVVITFNSLLCFASFSFGATASGNFHSSRAPQMTEIQSTEWSSIEIGSCCVALQLIVSFFSRAYFPLFKFRFVHNKWNIQNAQAID